MVVDFNTEEYNDVLSVNDVRYSGSVGPEGVVPTGQLTWQSDPGMPRVWRFAVLSSRIVVLEQGLFTCYLLLAFSTLLKVFPRHLAMPGAERGPPRGDLSFMSEFWVRARRFVTKCVLGASTTMGHPHY